MEAVPRLPMICCDLKISPSNTEFGSVLKKYIRDHYHEDADSYNKEIKELETLRQNAVKAPLDFTGCSILKRYYSQLHKLQSRFPMTDDGAACVPFMWTDIYSGVAYNITDIEYEEACILYNIGALHSKLGTMDSRCNAEGMKIACTHFQCAAWAFQHLRDTYPQPKGSDMSHDLLTFFINIMLAQAQECILEKSMLDNRKSSITAKIAAQVVDYYKCALGIMVSGSPSTDAGSILDIIGSKTFKSWKKFIEFKMSYYTSVSHLYMGNQAEENEKWGERVAWFQSAYDHLTESFKLAKNIDKDELNEPLTFTMDVIGGKHNSAKKENEFVYHEKVPALSSLPELKGASLVKGIPFSITDSDVSGPDIFARLVPMEAHETSSLYSEEKAKILRSVVAKVEGKNEELMAYLSSLQLESGMSSQDEEKIPQELLEKCAAMSVRPTAISDLRELVNELFRVSKDVETALKSSFSLLIEEEQKELKHQETFGNRGPAMITVELKKECSKYEEAHRKAVESNNTLQTAVNIHISNLSKLCAPLEELAESLPSVSLIRTPENIKVMDEFNHLINKVEEMKKQRQYLEQQLRDSLIKDDITKHLVTLDKKDNLQNVFAEELKKHSETLTYLDQNLAAQDNILCALTEANACYADTRKALTETKLQRADVVSSLVNSYEAYDDLIAKARKGLEFYQKLQNNVTRLLTRIRSVTKVQDEERAQRLDAELRKGLKMPGPSRMPSEPHVPKLKDYLPYMSKRGPTGTIPSMSFSHQLPQAPITPVSSQLVAEPIRQATMGGPATAEFDRKVKPVLGETVRSDDSMDIQPMGVRPAPVGSEQTSIPAMCTAALSYSEVGQFTPYTMPQQWAPSVPSVVTCSTPYSASYIPYNYSTQSHVPLTNNASISSQIPSASATFTHLKDASSLNAQGYNALYPSSSNIPAHFSDKTAYQIPQVPFNVTASNTMLPTSGINIIATSAFGSTCSVNTRSYAPVTMSVTGILNSSSLTSTGVSSSINQVTPSVASDSGYIPAAAAVSIGNVGTLAAGSSTFPTVPHNLTYLNNAASAAVSESLPSSTVGISKITPGESGIPPQSSSLFHHSVNPNQVLQSMGQNVIHQPFMQSQDQHTINQNQMHHQVIQNQVHPTWQTNIQTNHFNLPPARFAAPVPSFNSPAVSSGYSYASVQPVQYYQSTGTPTQAVQACVTASMDTSTSTFSSLNPYAMANPRLPHHSQESLGYAVNNSDVKSIADNRKYNNGTIQMHNTLISHDGSVTAISPSYISEQDSTVTSFPVHSNYPSNYNSFVHSTAQVSSKAVCAPDLSNVPGNINSHNLLPQKHSASTIQNDTIFSNQHSCQSFASLPNHCPAASSNIISGSTFTTPYQQLHTPEELKPVPSQPAQSLPLDSAPADVDSANSKGSIVQNSKSSVGCQPNVMRDFITPPPESHSLKTEQKDAPKESSVPILKPKVIDLQSIKQLKENESGYLAKDPLDDPSVCTKFVSEVEKYEKFVDGLVRKSLNGTTPLDQKWKEFIDAQDKESRRMSISVARCYPLKNRFPDVMPYDNNRVKLASAKDDYINASYLKDICPNSPVFVITQAPLPATFNDFWLMVWEQQVETLICLLSDSELKNHVYFPKERGQILTCGTYEISLHNFKEKSGFMERMINITHIKNRTSKVVVHLQFSLWPVSGVPSSPAPLLQFISDVLNYQKQQRNLLRPVVVHCSSGIGRSGCFCFITALVSEMNSGHGPRDVAQVAATVSYQRKFLIQDKDQLKFCYDTVLYYAQDLLMRRGILTTRASFDDKLPVSGNSSSHVRHPSEDFILGSGGLAKLQSGIAKMGLSTDSLDSEIKVVNQEITADENSVTVENDKNNLSGEKSKTEQSMNAEPNVTVLNDENPETFKDKKVSGDKNLPSITSLLDPLNFTLDAASSPAKRKITKENFATSKGSLSTSSSDSADPLSQLDPLWSLKK